MCASISAAEEAVPLGTFDPHFIPIPSPSFDTTKSDYVIGDHTYHIPRNYIRVTENDGRGVLSLVSMEALLPDMKGLARETARCFQNFQEPCNSDAVTIGLERGETTAFSQRLANIRKISPPVTKWVCGFEYYEDISPKIYHNGFRWLFKDFGDGVGGVVLRCPDEGSTVTRACVADENSGDGNSLYYVFHRDKICNWSEVRAKVRNLIGSFK